MKNLLLILSVLLSTSLSAVEYGQMFGVFNNSYSNLTNTVDLNDGDVIEILSVSAHTSQIEIAAYNDIENKNIFRMPFGDILQNNHSNIQIVGPCKVWVHSSSSSGAASYKLTRASEIQYQNGNIVSVPSDVQGAGTHNIVVETSSDLINWTPVHSSAISGGSEAFIRTRISTSE